MDLRERRELHNGFGESMNRAFELAGTPALFGWLGWWLDGRFDTRPILFLVLFTFTVTYLIYKNFSRYGDDIRAQQDRLFQPVVDRMSAADPDAEAGER